MNEPVRLLDSAIESHTRDLLTSAVLDEPDVAAFNRVLSRVSAGAVLGAASTAAAGSSVAPFAGTAVNGAHASLISIIAKWLGIGMLGGLATAGAAHYFESASNSARPNQVTSQESNNAIPVQRTAQNVPTSDHSQNLAEQRTSLAERKNENARDRDPRTAGGRPPSAETASAELAPVAQSNALAAEVAELDRARGALGRGDPGGALRALDTYAKLRRTGVLDREATIIRIDALVAAGDMGRAVELARRYLAEFPGDPHAHRLERLTTGR